MHILYGIRSARRSKDQGHTVTKTTVACLLVAIVAVCWCYRYGTACRM